MVPMARCPTTLDSLSPSVGPKMATPALVVDRHPIAPRTPSPTRERLSVPSSARSLRSQSPQSLYFGPQAFACELNLQVLLRALRSPVR